MHQETMMRITRLPVARVALMLALFVSSSAFLPASAQQSATGKTKVKPSSKSKPVWHSTIKEQGGGKAGAKPSPRAPQNTVTKGGAFLNFMVGGREAPGAKTGKETQDSGSSTSKP